MAWPASFTSQIRKTAIHVEVQVRTRGTPLNPIAGTVLSERQAGEDTIVIGSLAVEGEDLTLPGNTTSHGGFTVLVGWASADLVARRFAPGRLVEVQVAAHSLGKVDGAFQRWALGVVETIATQEDGTIAIGVQGLGALLGGRHEYGSPALFSQAGQALTTLTSGFTSGAGTAYVGDTSGWAGLDTESVYYFKVNDEIHRATGRTPTSFTGVTSARLGTSAATHSAGNDVVFIGCVYGHPIEIAYKILTSTGAGTNGTFDTLPADHGLAIGIDVVSTNLGDVTRTALSLGTWEAEFWTDVPVDDPGTWLAGYLNPLGFFITFAEGEILCRAVPNVATWPIRAIITDDDVCEDAPLVQELYDSRDSVEYEEVEYVISTGAVVETVTGTVRTTPAVATATVDLPGIYANAIPTAQDIGERTALYYLGRSGVVTGELAGLAYATLAPGDCVRVTGAWLRDPLSADFSFTAKTCVVLAAVPDLERARVAVTLKVPTEA